MVVADPTLQAELDEAAVRNAASGVRATLKAKARADELGIERARQDAVAASIGPWIILPGFNAAFSYFHAGTGNPSAIVEDRETEPVSGIILKESLMDRLKRLKNR